MHSQINKQVKKLQFYRPKAVLPPFKGGLTLHSLTNPPTRPQTHSFSSFSYTHRLKTIRNKGATLVTPNKALSFTIVKVYTT